MPVFKEELSEGERYLLQKCTEEYKDVVAQINELTARKAELVEKMVENGFGDHISGHLNLGDGNEIVMSFTQSVKVKQAEFKQLQDELPKEVLDDCFKPEYKLNKDAYNRLSDDVKNILSLCLEFRENAPRITIKSVPVMEAQQTAAATFSM